MNSEAWVAIASIGGVVGSIITGAIGHAVGRRGRDASATKVEADAADVLSGTVHRLGTQIDGLYNRLATAEARASAAEARASLAEAQVAQLREQVAQLSARLAGQEATESRLQAQINGLGLPPKGDQ